MAVVTLTIDDKQVSSESSRSLLDSARESGIWIPTLCHLDGLSEAAACRLCLVELAGTPRLFPACVTRAAEGMVVRTDSPKLHSYRKMILELLFAERNHICSVCVANTACELQALAARLGMDHVRFEYLNPELPVDTSHDRFGIDHNRCILCTRCVRACDEIEELRIPGTWPAEGSTRA